MDAQAVQALLTEIRDAQRQHLEEYRRIAGEALALQKQAVAQQASAVQAQKGHLRLYKVVLVVLMVLVVPLIAFLTWILINVFD